MKKIYFVVFILIILVLVLPRGIEKPAKVNLSIIQEPDVRENDTALKVAFASGVSPKESDAYYEELTGYISRKLGGPVKIHLMKKAGVIIFTHTARTIPSSQWPGNWQTAQR
jgi:ABC-type phosphate/phosphonate transport system substrate-binding protein